MKWFFTLLMICSLTACGRGVARPEVDQGEFRPYVERFEAVARENDVELEGRSFRIPIAFGETPSGADARCNWDLLGRSIVVKAETWEGLSEGDRWLLMSHELGHCVLDRQHVDYSSLMNGATLPSVGEYKAHRAHYDRELFHP